MSIYRLLLDFLGLFWLKTVKQTKIEEFVDIFDTFRRFLLVPILLGQYFYVFNNTVKRSIRLSFLYKVEMGHRGVLHARWSLKTHRGGC